MNTYIQSAATSTDSIFISPKGVAALTFAPAVTGVFSNDITFNTTTLTTGIATFSNSIVLQTSAPTNTVGYLGYTSTVNGNVAIKNPVVFNTIYSLISAGIAMPIGVYMITLFAPYNTNGSACTYAALILLVQQVLRLWQEQLFIQLVVVEVLVVLL